MIKIFVDSGSSIKQEEKDLYGVEILPLKILLNDVEYLDGVDLNLEKFYSIFLDGSTFPKTSLPSLEDAENRVNACVEQGYDVIIITISSGISGTHNALKMLFADNPKVRVIDSLNAVGGVKILVNEANKYLDQSLDFVESKLNEIAPRLIAVAVPETLEYLHKGGRLSAAGFAVGTLLRIKPIIALQNGVKVLGKAMGMKSAMRFIVDELLKCDTNYPIVPSYTYDDSNLRELMERVPEALNVKMLEKDNLDSAIASHWGPGAFGFVFVQK